MPGEGGDVVLVSHTWGHGTLMFRSGGEQIEYQLDGRGLRLDVVMTRSSEIDLAVLHDSSSYEIDLDLANLWDFHVILAVVGSGLGRRVSRAGLLAHQFSHY